MNAPITRWEVVTATTPNASYRVATEAAFVRPAAPARPAPTLARRVADALAYVASYPRRRMAMAELAGLSDRELADIGLTRAELRHAFRSDFRPARRL